MSGGPCENENVPSSAAAAASRTGIRGPAVKPMPPENAKSGSTFSEPETLSRKTKPPNGALIPETLPLASAKPPLRNAADPVISIGRGPGRPTVAPPSQRSPSAVLLYAIETFLTGTTRTLNSGISSLRLRTSSPLSLVARTVALPVTPPSSAGSAALSVSWAWPSSKFTLASPLTGKPFSVVPPGTDSANSARRLFSSDPW